MRLAKLARVAKQTQKKLLNLFLVSVVAMSGMFSAAPVLFPQTAAAETGPATTFDTFSVGSVNGQNGWSATGSNYDQQIEDIAGNKALRLSDAVTSGSFGDWIFAAPLSNSVGESDATNGSFSAGTKQNHFEMQFDIAAASPTAQPGSHVSVSPDRGDGSRMSYLRFEDQVDGIHVYFDDVQGTNSSANFVETEVAVLNRTASHTIRLTFDALDGPSNDIVKVYIDGALKRTGTSWENYFRYDNEASAEQSTRIVKTIIIQARGTADPSHLGHGFLFDNISLSSSAISTSTVVVDAAWAGHSSGTVETVGSSSYYFGVNAFATIQDGINAVTSGGTVNVVQPGTYSGDLSINKPLVLNGYRHGVDARIRTGIESLISGQITISSNDVTIDGFSLTRPGIQVRVESLSSVLSGVILQNNIFSNYVDVALPTYNAGDILVQKNLFKNPSASAEPMQIKADVLPGCSGSQVLDNSFSGAATNGSADINFSCTGSNSTNVDVSGNSSTGNSGGSSLVAFSGVNDDIRVANNAATTSGSTIFFFGNVSGSVLIEGNSISNASSKAVSINKGSDVGTSDSANSGIFTIRNNSFVTGTAMGVSVGSGALVGSGTVVASLNWWGSSSPNFSTLVSAAVTHDPYFTNSAMTTRSDAKVLPDSSGDATANNTTPQVVVTSHTQPVNITVTPGTANASIDYGDLVTGGSGTLPQTTINTQSATITIQGSTTVTASDPLWDGVITAPAIQPSSSVTIGSDKTIAAVIEVGANNISLTFDKAVRILIPGQAGKLVGFVRGDNFTQITTQCSADSLAAGNALVAGGDCYINSGSDLVIWTKHFTKFVAYSPAATTATKTTIKTTYTVRSGDTMSSIAARYGLSLAELVRLNPNAGHPVGNYDLILPGDVLVVSGQPAVTTASANEGITGESTPAGQIGSAASTSTPSTNQVKAAATTAAAATEKASGLKWYEWLAITTIVLAGIGAGYYIYRTVYASRKA